MSKISPDNFEAQIALLSAQQHRTIAWLAECPSTNTIAAQWAADGWRGCVIADHQTAGRGRLQRSWESDRGNNILLSWVHDWQCSVRDIPRLTLLLAAEIAHELDVYVKWPNDIMTREGHKIGGILSSIHHMGTNMHTVIIGVGLNVNQINFSEGLQATSLKSIRGAEQSRIDVLRDILCAMDRVDPQGTLERWTERSITLGKRVQTGERVGVATGIRADGALIVDGVPVTSGDVNLVEM